MAAWLLFALLAALLTGLVSMIDKKILLRQHAMEFSAVFSLTNAVLVFLLLPFVNFKINIIGLLIIYLVSWLGTLGFLFTTKAMRHMELSSVLPLMNFNPALVALLGVLFLREYLSLTQWGGMGLLLIGGYVLETRNFTHYKEFFHNIKKSRGIHYLFLSLLFYSFSAIADRYIVTKITDVASYLFFVLLFIAFNFFLLSSIIYGGIKDIKKGFKRHWKLLLLTGILTFGYRVSQIYAVSLVSVALVLSIKRLSTLFGVFFGGEIFHEHNLLRKIVATIIMLVGLLLIVI